MYDYKTGTFISSAKDDWREHFETTYYIKYNIEKALFSLEKIFDENPETSAFSNDCVYYHFYIDSLIDAIGQIKNRFKFKNKNFNNERIIRNIREYNFGELDSNNKLIKENYKNLNQNVRNFVQHIDEKDEILMKNNLLYGTFNVIFNNMEQNQRNKYLDSKRKQNNLLNLIEYTYKIYSPIKTKQNENYKYKEYTINLKELEKELIALKKINDEIFKILSDPLPI